MVKIKVKKEMDLIELIKWGFKNKIKDKLFFSSDAGTVNFNEIGGVSVNAIRQDTTFTVEVEEEITEETVVPKLIEFCDDDNDSVGFSCLYNIETRIEDMKDHNSIAFYMINDDMTMTLLWRNGEMVE